MLKKIKIKIYIKISNVWIWKVIWPRKEVGGWGVECLISLAHLSSIGYRMHTEFGHLVPPSSWQKRGRERGNKGDDLNNESSSILYCSRPILFEIPFLGQER